MSSLVVKGVDPATLPPGALGPNVATADANAGQGGRYVNNPDDPTSPQLVFQSGNWATDSSGVNQFEPTVISSVAGEQKFQSNVQPTINAANKAVTDANTQKAAIKQVAAAFGANQGTDIPKDVQNELDDGQSAIDKANQAQLDAWDQQKQQAQDTADSLTLAATESAKADIDALTSQWTQRRQLLQESNTQNLANWQQQFIRTGQAEYSPGMTGNLLTGKEQEGLAKLGDLDDEYNSKVSAINAALVSKKFSVAASLTSELNDIQDKALDLVKQNAKDAKATNDAIRAKTIQSSRDNAISNLVQQGITDPTQIMDMLNSDDNGNPTGGDFTADEVDKALKVFKPDDALKDVDSSYRTFQYLQTNQPDIVKGMTYMDYLKAVATAQRAPAKATDDTVSLTTPDKQKLLGVGFSANDIVNIEADINAHGVDEVLKGITDDRQKQAIQSVYGVEDTTPFLTTDYLAQLYGEDGLKKAAGDAGYRHILTSWDTEKQNYLDSLMNTVNQYRKAGYSDKDILKMMQS